MVAALVVAQSRSSATVNVAAGAGEPPGLLVLGGLERLRILDGEWSQHDALALDDRLLREVGHAAELATAASWARASSS